jgi:hypothetical protein
MGPPAGGVSPPGGGGRAGRGGRGDTAERRAPAGDERSRRVLDEVEAMDHAAAEGVRRIFTEAQRPKVDALLARRSELLSRARVAPAAATERPRPPPAGGEAGSPPPPPEAR